MVDLLLQQHPSLGIDLGVPADWSEDRVGDLEVRYLADEEQGYRTSIVLTGAVLDAATPKAFEELIGSVPDQLRARRPDLEVVTQRRFAQEGMPAWVLRTRWSAPELDTTIEQVLVLVVTDLDGGDLVQLDASTSAELAKDHLPLIQAVIQTVRPHGGGDAE